jgi:hypothetical protein
MTNYNIPESKGGDSPENVKKLEDRVEELGQTNGHIDVPDLIEIAKMQLFGDGKLFRAGGA